MIDSHCHLTHEQYASDVLEVLERAKAAGVEQLLTVATSVEDAEQCLALAEEYEQIYCTIGLHPHDATTWKPENAEWIRQAAQSHRKVVAIGEIGLDYHYMHSPKDVQQAVFTQQLEIAKELQLPCILHNRESIDDLKNILHEVEPQQYVVHCCSEKWADVAELVDAGHFLSFTGIATYAKSDDIRQTIQHCPMDQIMIETDAPYLAPVPYRGKRNEPAYVLEVAKCIAEIKGLPLEDVQKQTAANTRAFFNLTIS